MATKTDKKVAGLKKGVQALDLRSLKRKAGAGRQKVKKIQRQFYLRKPKSGVWFRVMAVDEPIRVVLTTHPETRDVYIVHPDFEDLVEGWAVAEADLIPYQTRQGGNVMIWPLKVPDGGPGNAWNETAAEAAKFAETQWTKMTANMADGFYEISTAEGMAHEPTWPDMPYEAIAEKAVLSVLVNSEDHTIFQDMAGLE